VRKRAVLAVVCLLLAPGVVWAQGINLSGGYGAGGAGEALRDLLAQRAGGPVELLLFGDADHDVFLGCLNCNKFDPAALDNKYGEYGSKFSGKSIFNKFIIYRNPHSPVSMCNERATNPPVIVERAGEFYGELTRNTRRPKRITTPAVIQWLGALCAGDLDRR
jgi:hypothetical protein